MSRTFKRTALAAAILTATLGLTACGSGSSSGDSSFTATSSGTTAKGIIKAGVVTAVELNSDKSEIGEVGSATTNADGTYELTLSNDYSGGPILLTLTTDANSEMKCDTVGGCIEDDPATTDIDESVSFGDWYQPGAGAIVLKALIPSAANGAAINASITPFTNMAAVRAMQEDSIDSETVSAANSEVSALLGINPLTTPPIDITDATATSSATSQQVVYAALSSAIANIAGTGGNVQTAIDNLASSFTAGTIQANDDDTDDAVISLQDIIDGANQTLTETGTTDNSGVINEMEDDVQTAEAGDGTINPEPTDTATASAVDKAKALIADFRTYANDLSNTINDPNFAASFIGEVETADTILSNTQGTDNLVTALAAVVEVYDNIDKIFEFNEDGTADDTYTFSAAEPSQFTSGSVRLVATTNMTAETDNGIDGTFNESESGTYNGTLTFTNAVVGDQTANITITMSNGEFSYSYDETTNDVDDTNNPYPNDHVETDNSAEETSISGTIIGSNGTSLTLDADTAFDYSFRGEYVDTNTSSTYSEEEREDFNISASSATIMIPTGESTSVTFTGEVSANGFWAYTYDDYFDKNNPELGNQYSFSDESYITSASLKGTVAAGDESISLEISGGMPNIETIMAQEGGETAESYLQMSAGIGFTVDLTDLNGVEVNFNASRTALDTATAQLNLSHGDRSILIETTANIVEAVDEMTPDQFMGLSIEGGTGEVTVTNPDGVVMTISPPEEGVKAYAQVTVDGIIVAEITETEDGLIKASYSDGTFEIF
ncbi:exported hypothetical protein [uncultured Thiomicrorhabdus sp.]